MTRAQYQAKYGVAPNVPLPNPLASTPAGGSSNIVPATIPKAAPVAAPAPANNPDAPATSTIPVRMTRAQYQEKYGVPPPGANSETAPAKAEGGSFLKNLISAPATILARPFQAIEAGADYIQDAPKIDQYKKESADITKENDDLVDQLHAAHASGADSTDIRNKIQANNDRLIQLGTAIQPTLDRKPTLFKDSSIVAPVPQNAADVEKDIGRGIQTVALGLGPVAGGAAFGAGNSLEQGNDLFSVQTAFQTVLGAGAGKVLDLVGKPLLNAAGKVVGTITPQILKDVAGKGAGAIADFAANHELLGGAVKPLATKIESGANAIEQGANSLFTGAKEKISNAVTSQYPGLSKGAIQDHYVNVEKSNFAKPAQQTKGFVKASEIFDNAQKQGTDLADEAVKNGIRHDDIIDGKLYSTGETADNLREDAMKTSHDLIRPALAAAEPGVERVPISEVRSRMISEVDKIPSSKLTDTERSLMKSRIEKQYGDTSPAAIAHPNGYSLTDLHDAKIAHASNGKFSPVGTPTQNFPARINQEQSQAFRKLLEENAPAELKVKDFNAALQKKFQLADYLDALNGKKVPSGIVRKAVDLFGKVLGASAGSQIGGGLGGVAGYHIGGALFNSFDNLSNPVKAAFLKGVEKTQPEVFQAFRTYLGDQELERLTRLKLPAAGGSSFKEPQQRFFTTPKGKTSANLQEATDIASTEKKSVKKPKGSDKGRAKSLKDLFDNTVPNIDPKDLPVIKIPKRSGKLKGIYDGLPTIRY